MRSYTVKENQIGSAVSEILCYRQKAIYFILLNININLNFISTLVIVPQMETMETIGVPLQPMEMEELYLAVGMPVVQKVSINYLHERMGKNIKFVCCLIL